MELLSGKRETDLPSQQLGMKPLESQSGKLSKNQRKNPLENEREAFGSQRDVIGKPRKKLEESHGWQNQLVVSERESRF